MPTVMPMQPADPEFPAPLSWARTRALMRSDFARILDHVDVADSLPRRFVWFVQPHSLGLCLYRLAHYLYRRGWRASARLVATFNIYLTRVEIPPTTVIGESCLLGHCPIVLCGRIGDRFTLWGDGGIGGGFGSEDVGGGPGLPRLGDDVVMSVSSRVLGPVRVGHGARIGPGAMVLRDVPAGAVVSAPLSRTLGGAADEGAP